MQLKRGFGIYKMRKVMAQEDKDYEELIDAVKRCIMEESKAFDKFFYGLSPDVFEGSNYSKMKCAFEAGIDFYRSTRWKPCDGEDLPPYEKSVLVRMADVETGEFFSETFCHRSNNPEVVTDKNGWVIRSTAFKYTEWCYIPEFIELIEENKRGKGI